MSTSNLSAFARTFDSRATARPRQSGPRGLGRGHAEAGNFQLLKDSRPNDLGSWKLGIESCRRLGLSAWPPA